MIYIYMFVCACVPVCVCLYVYFHNKTSYIQYIHYKLVEFLIKAMMILFVLKTKKTQTFSWHIQQQKHHTSMQTAHLHLYLIRIVSDK